MKTRSRSWLISFVSLPGILLLISLLGCEQFGNPPSGSSLDTIKLSPNYHLEDRIFVNQSSGILRTMGDDLSLWSDPFGKKRPNFLFNKMQSRPEKHLPEITNSNLKEFQDSQKNIKFIWLGHSTILLSINGKVVLIDPVFSKSASPVSFLAKRFQSPAIPLAKLPVIDYILISHDHYDHLDMETIKHFVEQDVRFVVPLGVGSHLQHWGIDPHKIIELDWWQTEKTGSLVFTAIPAQHYSGRLGPISPMKTLWASWVIKSPTRSVYFSGDSGYHSHYREIGQKHGPFDIVFMDSGQYNARWRSVHNMPEEVVLGFKELKGEYLVPIHWAMFNLSLHNWYDPGIEITAIARDKGVNLITPRLGQLVTTKKPVLFDEWWKEIK